LVQKSYLTIESKEAVGKEREDGQKTIDGF
jgi:hypothetical protein